MTAEPGGDRSYGLMDGRTLENEGKCGQDTQCRRPPKLHPRRTASVKDGALCRSAGRVPACVRARARTKEGDRLPMQERPASAVLRFDGGSSSGVTPAADRRRYCRSAPRRRRPTLARGLVSPGRGSLKSVGRPTGREINSPKCKTGVKRTAARCR
jgi:hypothetical protein